MNEPTPVEEEIKLPLDDPEGLRARLAAGGWSCVQRASRETNQLFDTADEALRRSGRVLRLRRYGGCNVLTCKGPAEFAGGVKRRTEIEVEVGAQHAMGTLLEALGFRPTRRYEKDRELWRREHLTLCLDHTPLGEFVEIEGPADELSGALATLDLDPAQAVEGSYLDLWEAHRRAHPEDPRGPHMVFRE